MELYPGYVPNTWEAREADYIVNPEPSTLVLLALGLLLTAIKRWRTT